jgi:hypothetical protein
MKTVMMILLTIILYVPSNASELKSYQYGETGDQNTFYLTPIYKATTIDNGKIILLNDRCDMDNSQKQFVYVPPFGYDRMYGCWKQDGDFIIGIYVGWRQMDQFKWDVDDFEENHERPW